jgi:hypothetical protein
MMLSSNEVEVEAGNKWLLDSGATCHVTYDQSDLIEFKETSINITAANGTNLKVHGIGKVELKLNQPNSGSELMLRNVYYAPELKSKIISERRATKAGFNITKLSNQCILQRQDIKIHAKISDNGLWFISGTSTSDQVNAITRLQALEKLQKANDRPKIPIHHDDIQNIDDMDPLQLLHYRLDHVNFKYIKQYIKHHNQKVTDTGMECKTCSLSKGCRQPVAKESTQKPEHPSHIVHADLMGPFPSSASGKQYALLITDGFS